MAVDPNFNWVRSLVQGASTENRAGTKWPTTVTGSTAGTDYLGLASGDLTVTPSRPLTTMDPMDIDLSAHTGSLYVLRQLVIQNLPTWTVGARVLEGEDFAIRYSSTVGRLEVVSMPQESSIYTFDVPTTGAYTLEVTGFSAWGYLTTGYSVFVNRVAPALPYYPHFVIYNSPPTRSFATKTGYTRVGGGGLDKTLTPSADFTITRNLVTQGYLPATSAVPQGLALAKDTTSTATVYPAISGRMWPPGLGYSVDIFPVPAASSTSTHAPSTYASGSITWRIGAGTAALPYFTATVNVAGLTWVQAATIAGQSLAAQVNAAFPALKPAVTYMSSSNEGIGTTSGSFSYSWAGGTWGGSTPSTFPGGSATGTRTGTIYRYYDMTVILLPLTGPTASWPTPEISYTDIVYSSGGPPYSAAFAPIHVHYSAQTVPATYGLGAGLPSTITFTITGASNADNGAAIMPSLSGSGTSALAVATTPSALDAANFFAGKLETEATSSIVTFGNTASLTLVTKSPMTVAQAMIDQVTVGRRVPIVSGVDRLYGFKLTLSKSEGSVIALPWPTTSIPPDAGGGGGGGQPAISDAVWLALSFEGDLADKSVYAHPAVNNGNASNVLSGSRTGDGYILADDNQAFIQYDANLNDLNGLTEITIEFDIYVPFISMGSHYFFGTTGGDCWLLNYVDTNVVSITPGGAWGMSHCQATFTPNAWHHLAWSTSATWAASFVDGVMSDGNGISSLNFSANVTQPTDYFGPLRVGTRADLSVWPGLRMDNVVITKAKKYTANFTPPASFTEIVAYVPPISDSALYLKFEDGTGNATAANSGTGGGSFPVTPHAIVSSQFQDGAGSLQLTGVVGEYTSFTPITGPGTGDYTAEMWVRFPSLGAGSSMFAGNFNTGGFYVGDNGQIGWIGGNNSNGMGDVVPNVWHHIAAVRQTGMVYFYLNGVMSSSTSGAPNTANLAAPFGLGEDNSYGAGVAVFIDEYRFTNSALYTSNFTPESPLDDTPIVAPTNDVTGAGYNDVAALTSTGSGSQQANFPDSYGFSSATLGSFTVTTVAYIDAADLTGTGSSTLDSFTCTADGVAADPTNMDGSSALDDFTCAADGVASTPTEFTANYALGDFTSLAVGLFLAPSEGSGASSIDAITCMATCTITEPETLRGTFTMPSPQFTATSTRTVFRGFVGSAPFMYATAQSGHRSVVTSPAMKASATATTVQMARAIMTMPMADVFSTGRVSGTAAMFARMPSADSTALGGHQAVMESPSMTATATGIHGGVAHVAARMPWVVTLISGYREDTGRVIASMPMLVPTPSATASVQPPMFTATARGHAVLANAYEAYVLNMSQQIASDQQAGAVITQMTRYTNWPFVQVVRLGDIYYGLAEDGLYELGGPTDNGTEIAWSFETCKTDFGDPHKKAVVSAYVGGQAGPVVDYTLRSGDDPDYMYEYVTNKVTQKRNHRQKFGLGRRVRYYSFGLAGTGKLAIDEIEFELMNTTRRI